MPLFQVRAEKFEPVEETTFTRESVRERDDLQRLLRDQINVLDPNLMVLAEEFGDWEESRRRIDLLCLDKKGNPVVVELKRTEDGGHSDLQAIRYAAMVSKMNFEQAVEVHDDWRRRREMPGDARATILDFLEWTEVDEDAFGSEVRIILAAADFSKEVTTTVLWLRELELDIRCVRIKPYRIEERLLVDVEEIIPLPEAEDYLERVRKKERAERESRANGKDLTRFDVTVNGVLHEAQPKNRAMLLVARGLVASGIHPDEIAETIGWKTRSLWRSCDGEHTPQSFAAAMQSNPEVTFDLRRWFARDGELIVHGGRTYALHSNWGGQQTIDWLFELSERWPNDGVEIRIHQEGPASDAA